MHVKFHGVVLHYQATLLDNTNVVSKIEYGDQMVHGAFCQAFMKSCQFHFQITNNIAKILLKFRKTYGLGKLM